MTAEPDFQEDLPRPRHSDQELMLDLDGFEGPIDLLLSLAQEQKVDLAKISVLALADQYLAYIQQARALHLEIAAGYLVMAAWLAWMKSRLLLPESPVEGEEETPAELAARLAFQLQRLEAMQEAAARLFALPQLGQAFFSSGRTEALRIETHAIYSTTLYDLLRAYGHIRGQKEASLLRIAPTKLYSVEQAAERLRQLLGGGPDWRTLESFLPKVENEEQPMLRRSALASHFTASLELAREGVLSIRQAVPFAPIWLRTTTADADEQKERAGP